MLATTIYFVTKLNNSGTAYIYSTYLGGNQSEAANAVAVDTAGNAYITGFNLYGNFPVVNAYQATPGTYYNVIVLKITDNNTYGLSGRITAQDGSDISNVTVTLTGGSQTITATTNSTGRYFLTNIPPGGNYTVTRPLIF